MVRRSPGSPSQWMATAPPRAAACRSTQLTAAFSSPPTNHRPEGPSGSKTAVGVWSQERCPAASDHRLKNRSRSLIGRSLIGEGIADHLRRPLELSGEVLFHAGVLFAEEGQPSGGRQGGDDPATPVPHGHRHLELPAVVEEV